MGRTTRLILDLSKKDFKVKFLGSYLGVMWAFINPLVLISIFWFVFQVGFKTIPVNNVPFILWLVCGLIPWFFFNDSVTNATFSVEQNSYLVKKMVFKVSILPIIKIVSSFYVHIFYLFVIFILGVFYGYGITVYHLQLLYYIFCLFILILGISYLTSSLIIFLKDIGQIVSMILQFLFWLTPIFWSFNILPEKYQSAFKLNPLYYITQGYRDTIIYHKWFWEQGASNYYFWIVTLFIFCLGVTVFKRLRPHFADVL